MILQIIKLNLRLNNLCFDVVFNILKALFIMPVLKVKVKWGRENLPIEVNTEEEPLLFKAQIYALTGVQPHRQKVMWKGSQLRDNEWNVQLKDGATILLLGSKEEITQEPQVQTKFIEDMNEIELATALEFPSGLTNLGNTCYMNATVQCLKSVPELRQSLAAYSWNTSTSSTDPAGAVTAAMKHLVNQMEKGITVTPIMLLQTLHKASPQFSQTGENGVYRQQDANECWAELLKMMQQKLPAIYCNDDKSRKHNSFIDQYFGGTFEVQMKCCESMEEPISYSSENFLQLSCFISPEVKYMLGGLKSKMQEQLTKYSESLERNAIYKRSSLISRLPAYITVQFVRFQYKGKEGINAKVLKDIKFPIEFDAYELCTLELQKKLTPMRMKFKNVEDSKFGAKLESSKTKNIITENEKHLGDDSGSNNSGYYSLQAVLTHKGRSSSSGHYVAWVKQSTDCWMKFDDDIVTPATTDDILKLSGGGDWHCAYVLLYASKYLQNETYD